MVVITTAEGVFYRANRGDPIGLEHLFLGRMLDWYTCAALVPPLYWITSRLPIGRAPLRIAAPLHLAATAGAAALKYILYVPLRARLEPGYDRTISEAIYDDFLGKLMFFWAVSAVLHAIVLHRARQPAPGDARPPEVRAAPAPAGTIALADGRTTRFIPQATIEWAEAQGNYVMVHTARQHHLVRETMQRLAGRLDQGRFVRVHRSAIVNLDAIARAEPLADARYRLHLLSGATLTTGRTYAPDVDRLIGGSRD